MLFLLSTSVGYPNVCSIGTHTHTHKHFGFSACMERKLHTLFMCTVCLWKEANCLHVLPAKHSGKPHHFPSKKYSFCSSLLSQQMEYAGTFWAISGGEMWKKKGEVVYLWCDLSTQENTVCVCHGKHTQWKESLLFTSGNSKHFFVCV